MANKLYEENDVKAVANAIRSRNGKTDQYTIAEMSAMVKRLPSAVPFTNPGSVYNEEKASEIVAVAQTWLDAVNDGRLVIVYASGYSALSGENQRIKNDDGVYCIQCSAFVGLILRGICYEDSPYYDGDGSKTTARTDLYSWANTYYEKNGLTEANNLAEYALQNGCMLKTTDISAIKKADLLFFTKSNTEHFGNIWHVAMALETGGVTCIHALSGNASSGIWTYDMTNPPNTLGELAYIARPQYNVDFSVVNETVELKILEQPTDQSGAAGTNVVFTVVAQGDGLTYQWQYAKAATPNNWQNSTFEGYDTTTQTVGIASYRDGDYYRCIITDENGNTVTSDAAKIIMTS